MQLSQTKNYLLVNGIIAGQTPGVIKVLEQVLPHFERVIEIGSGRGAFSFWLSQHVSDLYTFDISGDRFVFPNLKDRFTVGDCFDAPIQRHIQELIQNPNQRVLLMCDGGDKEREFNTFASFLKPNDVVMCHDFAEDAADYQLYKKQNNWPTNSESHLQNLKLDHLQKFEPFYDDLKSVFWGAFQKMQ